MATFNKFNSFVEAIAHGVHDLGEDTLMLALTKDAPTAADSVLADLNEIDYTYCSSRVMTRISSGQVDGKYTLICADLIIAATGGLVGPLRYVVLYNADAGSQELIGYWDYGSEFALNNGETFTIDVNALTGVLTII